MSNLRLIGASGLANYQRSVDVTAKTVEKRRQVNTSEGLRYEGTGEFAPNPNYDNAVRQLEAAHYHYDTAERIREKASAQGYQRNRYEGTCSLTGDPVRVGAGFVKRVDGRWRTYSFFAVTDQLGITLGELPELE